MSRCSSGRSTSPGVDVDAKLRTVGHGQRVVNGFAGFVPDLQRELSGRPGRGRAAVRVAGGPDGPGPDLSAALSGRPRRDGARRPPSRRDGPWPTCRAGSSASGAPTGTTISTRSCRCRSGASCWSGSCRTTCSCRVPTLRAALRPVRTQAGVEQWVSLTLNGAPVTRAALDAPTILSATLSWTAPAGGAQRDRVRVRVSTARGRARPRAPAGRDGRDGPCGRRRPERRSAVRGHGVHPCRDRRARAQPARLQSGRPRAVGSDPGPCAFDTFGDPTASGALAAWVRALARGHDRPGRRQGRGVGAARRRRGRGARHPRGPRGPSWPPPGVPRLHRREGRAAGLGPRGAGPARRRGPGGGAGRGVRPRARGVPARRPRRPPADAGRPGLPTGE